MNGANQPDGPQRASEGESAHNDPLIVQLNAVFDAFEAQIAARAKRKRVPIPADVPRFRWWDE